jgi:hypothetical protein
LYTRAKTVGVTDAGKKVIRQAVHTVEKFDATFIGPLGEKTHDFNKKLLLLLKKKPARSSSVVARVDEGFSTFTGPRSAATG